VESQKLELVEITIEQEPVIQYESVIQFSNQLKQKLASLNISKMEATEENKKTLKDTRADINKVWKEIEDSRKNAKNVLMKPYDDFEKVYKEKIKEPIEAALDELKEKIDRVEDQEKEKKEQEILDYFNEKKEATQITYAEWQDLGIRVGISTSINKTRTAIDQYFEKLLIDQNKIHLSEHKEILMKHFIKNRNLEESVRLTEQELADKAKAEALLNQEFVTVPEPVIVDPPKAKPAMEKMLVMEFKVWGTRTQLKELKEFMEREGIKYE